MFTALLELLKSVKINAQISLHEDGEILVLMLPERKEGQSPLISSPMRFKGTAVNLEQTLGAQLTELIQTRHALAITVESQIEESKKQAQELIAQAKKKVEKAKPKTSPTTPKSQSGLSDEDHEGDVNDHGDEDDETPVSRSYTVPTTRATAPVEKAKPEVKNPWG